VEAQTQAGINEESLGNFCTALAQINTISPPKKSACLYFKPTDALQKINKIDISTLKDIKW